MKEINCKICGTKKDSQFLLSSHIRHIHKLKHKDYYDIYIKSSDEGLCLICNRPTKLHKNRYRQYCSLECAKRSPFKERHKIETNLKKFGVTNSSLLPEYKSKNSQTMKIVCDQIPKAVYENRLNKRKQTNLQKFGQEYTMQNPIYFDKCMKTQWTRKMYTLPSGKLIYLMGYEPQFLDYIFNNNILNENEIIYKPNGISYNSINGGDKKYYPDFQIPKLNLIIEIKSSYTLKVDKNIELKRNACIRDGFRYIRIVNNDFSEFDLLWSC